MREGGWKRDRAKTEGEVGVRVMDLCPSPRRIRSLIFVKVGCYSCCWLYRREVRQLGLEKWDEGMNGLFMCTKRGGREERGDKRENEEKCGDGLTVKCALVVCVAGFALVSLVF